MRNKDRWESTIQQKVSKRLFPPRIVQDLIKYDLRPIEEKSSLFICSRGKATGKTLHAAQVLLGWECQSYMNVLNTSCCFLTVTDLVNDLKATFDDKTKSEIDLLVMYQNMDVLVLDDLGNTKLSDWMYHILYSLINYRYEHLKPTIITSNYTLTELETAWQDDRLTSRMTRMCEIIQKER